MRAGSRGCGVIPNTTRWRKTREEQASIPRRKNGVKLTKQPGQSLEEATERELLRNSQNVKKIFIQARNCCVEGDVQNWRKT